MPRKADKWADMMLQLLGALDLSQAAFAKRIGATPGAVQSRITGSKGKPPLGAELDAWVKALRLEGEIADRFIRLAEMEHIPGRLKREILETQDMIDTQTKRMTGLEREMAIKDKQLKELRSQLTDALAQLPKK